MTPTSAGTTDAFTFNMYRDFDFALDYALTNHMLSGSIVLDSSRFISGRLTDGAFESKVNFIQTNNILTLSFTVGNAVPGYDAAGAIHPRIILIIPKGFVISESTAG
jgi:hypothetical protein